jgi:hypothetical protein
MIEYISAKNVIDLHMRENPNVYVLAWNEALDAALEQKNIVRAVPEEAFETTKRLLTLWRDEAKAKKQFAIADQDISTAEIKRNEELTYNFALQILEKLEKYGEDEEEGGGTYATGVTMQGLSRQGSGQRMS